MAYKATILDEITKGMSVGREEKGIKDPVPRRSMSRGHRKGGDPAKEIEEVREQTGKYCPGTQACRCQVGFVSLENPEWYTRKVLPSRSE